MRVKDLGEFYKCWNTASYESSLNSGNDLTPDSIYGSNEPEQWQQDTITQSFGQTAGTACDLSFTWIPLEGRAQAAGDLPGKRPEILKAPHEGQRWR